MKLYDFAKRNLDKNINKLGFIEDTRGKRYLTILVNCTIQYSELSNTFTIIAETCIKIDTNAELKHTGISIYGSTMYTVFNFSEEEVVENLKFNYSSLYYALKNNLKFINKLVNFL